MARVDRARRFSNPTKIRVIGEDIPAGGIYSRALIDQYTELNNENLHRAVIPELYIQYSDELWRNMNFLKGHETLFLTSESPDMTLFPNPMGFQPRKKIVDIFSDQSRLSEEILRICNRVYQRAQGKEKRLVKSNLENVLLFPVFDVMLPAVLRFQEGYVSLKSPLERVIGKLDRRMHNYERQFGVMDKRLSFWGDLVYPPRPGIYEGSSTYYLRGTSGLFSEETESESMQATVDKIHRTFGEMFPDEKNKHKNVQKVMEVARHINRNMLKAQYAKLQAELQLNDLFLFSLMNSYAYQSLKSLNPKGFDLSATIKTSELAECDPGPLGKLEGWFEGVAHDTR